MSKKSYQSFFTIFFIVIVFFVSTFSIASDQIQPVFSFPLDDGYISLCTQGNNGSTSHQFNSTRHDIDFDTPNPGQTNDPQSVIAAADGVAHIVSGCFFGSTKCNSGFGNFVKISHGDDIFSIYAHLESISINDNNLIRQGDVIGTEGSTGQSVNSNGGRADHLHFGVHIGDPKDDLPGRSVSMDYMAVPPNTSDENAEADLISGGDFICGIPGGKLYEAIEVPECHTRDGGDLVFTGFGAPYNVFDEDEEVLLRATCTPDDTRISIGNNTETMYVYHKAHEADRNGNITEIQLQCIGEKINNIWCLGEAIGKIKSTSKHFLAYSCLLDGEFWKCGCRDKKCNTSNWQLQTVDRN